MNKEIKLNKNIIFFDVETNGFQGSSVLSMSAIKVNYNSENTGEERNKWKKVSEFNRFYFRNEGEELNEGAINVNGLTDENISILRKDRNYSKYFEEDYDFEDFCDGVKHFVAHNISFDSQFLNIPYMRKFCTMNENVNNVKIEGKYGKYKWPKLNETAKYYGIEVDELSTHRSDYDTYLCKEIFVKMLKDNNYNSKILEFLNVE